MKQTAVEWLMDTMLETNSLKELFKKEIKKAKEMEKQQIIDAANLDKRHYDNAEQYYNETFKNK